MTGKDGINQEVLKSSPDRITSTPQKPPISYHHIDLPLTRLHYVKYGEGPPLIVVPATISEIDNWLSLVYFMGQRFTVHFFELPGHGQSSAFKQKFSSDLVAETVEDLIDALGFSTISLMGFSFGGLLTMKTLYRLQDRIEQVLIISPAATHRALIFRPIYKAILRGVVKFLSLPVVCKLFTKAAQSDLLGNLIAECFHRFVSVERSIPLRRRFKEIKTTTIEVLAQQMIEVLNLDLPIPEKKFKQPCYFTMSIHDPLLDYETTLEVMNQQFENVMVEKLYFPYHQPEVLPNFEDMQRDYINFLTMIK